MQAVDDPLGKRSEDREPASMRMPFFMRKDMKKQRRKV